MIKNMQIKWASTYHLERLQREEVVGGWFDGKQQWQVVAWVPNDETPEQRFRREHAMLRELITHMHMEMNRERGDNDK